MMRPIQYSLILICLVFVSCQHSNNITKELKKSIGTIPAEDIFWQRNYPEKTFDHKSYFDALQKAAKSINNRSLTGTWVDQGPGNLGGRINTMAIQSDNEDVMYLGFSRGGLYKTTDGGLNWVSIFNEFTYLSISHVEIDPNDPNTIYIGTGDENITGYPEIGNGIYKSIDGGSTWKHLGLSKESIIGRIHVSPTNTDIIYASAMGIPFEKNNDRGVYKSIDGGNQWEQVLFLNDSTGIIDLLVDPTNPDIAYAAGWNRLRSNYISIVTGPDAKIWKTIDGGATWNILSNGLPSGNFGRIGLDMMASNSKVIIASYSGSRAVEGCSGTANQLFGIYKSTDAGVSWTQIPTNEDTNGLPCNAQGGFAWYFGQIRIHPTNPNDITMLGVKHYRTLDNGLTWSLEDPAYYIHADCHDFLYYNNNTYIATDGGAYKSNQDLGWDDIENISTNQIYRVAYNPHNPDLHYAGLQDNGSTSGNQNDINNWNRIYGGDGFQIVFHPEDPNIMFAESQNGNIIKLDNGFFEGFSDGLEGSTNWDMPYFFSNTESEIMYTGTNKVYRRNQKWDSEWTAISPDLTDLSDDSPYYQHNITTLDQSPSQPDYLYVGTTDGIVSRSEPNGTWTNITEGLIRRYVTDIKASPSDPNTVYVTLSGYKNNDNTPLVYKSVDRGDTWTSIMGDLPMIAANDIYIMPNSSDSILFVANEAGVYYTTDSGNKWERLGENLPYIPVYDLEYNPIYNQLIAGTFGRGLQTFELNQVNIGLESSINTPIAQKYQIKTYPTITDGIVYIESDIQHLQVKVYNNTGQILLTKNIIDPIIDLNNCPAGVLYLEFSYNDKREVHKILKY